MIFKYSLSWAVSLVFVISVGVDQVGVAVVQNVSDQALLVLLLCLVGLVEVLVVIEKDLLIQKI